MDVKLLEASQSGNIECLHQYLRENPLILDKIAVFPTENPLHVASTAGHADFVRELIRLKPEFCREINEDGISPMHMAAAIGRVEIVKELMKVDPSLCRLEGKEKMTPLHCAAIKGRAEVISAMLFTCPDCIEDVTVQRDTALHLAVKNNQFEAIKAMVDWVRDTNKEDILNMKDELGNTVLHLATWKRQRQVMELLLDNGTFNSSIMQVNAENDTGITALDVLMAFPSRAGDREMVEILRGGGAMRAKDITVTPNSSSESANQTLINIPIAPERCQTSQGDNLLEYFGFKKGRDSPSETRSALLVVAILVATATYQVGVNPPGGVWQDSYIPDRNSSTKSVIRKAHYAGESVMATSDDIAFCLFMLFNSIGFSVSLFMINILTIKFPLQFELQVCMIAMYSTYNTASITLSPDEVKLYVILAIIIACVLIPLTIKYARPHAKRVKQFAIDVYHRII